MLVVWVFLGLFGFLVFLVLLVFALLLLVPFRFEVAGMRDDFAQGEASLSWLAGLIGLDMEARAEAVAVAVRLAGRRVFSRTVWPPTGRPGRRGKAPEAKEEVKEEPAEAPPAPEAAPPPPERRVPLSKRIEQARAVAAKAAPHARRIWQQFSAQVLVEGVRLLMRMLRSLKLKAEVEGTVGLGDPADTAMLFGAFYALRYPLNLQSVTLSPDYFDLTVTGSARLSGRIWFAQLVVHGLRFVFARPVRRVWWTELKALVFHGGGSHG